MSRSSTAVRFTGPKDDDAARAKLLEIVDKCPVHRTLHGERSMPTRPADRSPP